ncbi:MAG: T9SS type A sorting domain-containing protein, partial [Bacteroidota bacterium]|nr:T9SS type A sorting domain-containing protein [Bacteroidota bacterium]
RLGGNGTEELRTVFQTSDDDLLLGGRSNSGVSGDRTQPSQGAMDYWLVKLTPITSNTRFAKRESTFIIEPVGSENQLKAYPNPFTDRVTINVNLTQPAAISLQIYTPTGQQLRQIDYGVLNAGEQYLLWNGKDTQNRVVKPGLYLYRTVVNGQLKTGKLFKTE